MHEYLSYMRHVRCATSPVKPCAPQRLACTMLGTMYMQTRFKHPGWCGKAEQRANGKARLLSMPLPPCTHGAMSSCGTSERYTVHRPRRAVSVQQSIHAARGHVAGARCGKCAGAPAAVERSDDPLKKR